MEIAACQKGKGWHHVQLDNVTQLEKTWNHENEVHSVHAFFGTLRDGRNTPAIIMNVSIQGCGATKIIDENCDIWENVFTSTTKEDGNEYYKYLKKHGFCRVED